MEERDEKNRPRRWRPTQGTPQGGVISPLLANLYLHWFDGRFHRDAGPGTWAHARLVRYADDFVILARTITLRVERWVEAMVEAWLGLTINRRTTRVVRLAPRLGESISFLGYTFQYERDQHGRAQYYLAAVPSQTAVLRCWQAVRQIVSTRRGHVPLAVLIGELNRMLQGWQQYDQFGYPRCADRRVNAYVLARLTKHAQRRSQRPCRPPAGGSWHHHLTHDLGLRLL